jgi:parallel beta helix pectate lyase-like protein
MKFVSNNRSVILSSLLSTVLLMSSMSAFSDVPQVISYSGQLNDKTTGNPIDTTVNLTFNLYKDTNGDGDCDADPSPCVSIWSETHTGVTVSDGLFGVSLGSVGGTLGGLGFDVPYLLGIEVNSDGEMGTLLRLTSAPTALVTENTQGSSVAVNCASGSIQAALDAGATTITIDGVCQEAVSITRSGVTLVAEGAGTDGIEGPADGDPALSIVGASQVSIQGLTITEASGSTDETCVQVISGADATFSGISVSSYPDIGVSALLNSSANFSGAASTITGGVVGLEVVAGSSANITDVTISGFADEGIFVGGNSFAFLEGPTITATASDAAALLIEGSSSVEVDDVTISSSNGNGVSITGSSSLALFDEGGTISISGSATGIFVYIGSIQAEAGSVSSSAGSAVEIHNTSTASISDSANLSGGTYGVACFSNAVLNTFNTPTITGTTAATNSGNSFCTFP